MHTEPAEKPNKTMIKITRIGPNEIDALRAISIWTFEETFAAENTAQDLAKYVEQAFGKEKLLAEIKDPGSFFYFAETDGRTIGYLKVNAGGAQTEIQDARSVEIERIYVLQEFHGMKAGQVLCAGGRCSRCRTWPSGAWQTTAPLPQRAFQNRPCASVTAPSGCSSVPVMSRNTVASASGQP